jgi:DNA-binding GntR family transcriptional regulator
MEKQTPEDQLKDVALHCALGEAIAARDPEAAEAAAVKLVGEPPSAFRG